MLTSCTESTNDFDDSNAKVSSSSALPTSSSSLSSAIESSSSSISVSSSIEPTFITNWQGESLDSLQLVLDTTTAQWIYCLNKQCAPPFSNAFRFTASNFLAGFPQLLRGILTKIDFRKFSDLELPMQDSSYNDIRLQIQLQWAKSIHARSVKIPNGEYDLKGVFLDSISIIGESELSTKINIYDSINCHYSSLQNLNLNFSDASLIAQSCSLSNSIAQSLAGTKPLMRLRSSNLEVQNTNLRIKTGGSGIQLDSGTQFRGSEIKWNCLESNCKDTKVFTLGKNTTAFINTSILPNSFSASAIGLDSLAVLDWTTGELNAQISSHPKSKIRLRNLTWNGTFITKPDDLLCLTVGNGTQSLDNNCQ